MKARVLPREEWGRLSETAQIPIWETVHPDDVAVVVVEDGGRIVMQMAVLQVTHFEGLWIAPEYRGHAGAARGLIRESVAAAKKWAKQWVWGAADTDHMRDILDRVGGVKLPIDTYVLPIGAEERCPQQ